MPNIVGHVHQSRRVTIFTWVAYRFFGYGPKKQKKERRAKFISHKSPMVESKTLKVSRIRVQVQKIVTEVARNCEKRI